MRQSLNPASPALWIVIGIAAVIALYGFFVIPQSARAATEGLITCGLNPDLPSGASEKEIAFCTICDLIILVQNLMNKAMFYFAAPISALMLGYGGFLMVLAGLKGGNASMFTQGRKVLTATVIGIVLLFGSWLMVDTILKGLGAYQYAGSSPSFGPWNKIQCQSPEIAYPKHMGCNGDKCELVSGSGGSTCDTKSTLNNCKQHFGCNDKEQCVVIDSPGLDSCTQNPNSCPKTVFRCLAGACVETKGSFTTSDCDPKNNGSECKGGADTILTNEEAIKRIANTLTQVDDNGDCKGPSGVPVSALTNFGELASGEPLTVCHNSCKTDGKPCTKQGFTANTKMLSDMATVAEAGMRYKINSIASGDHEKNSDHYTGKAVDLGVAPGIDFPALKQKFLDLNQNGQIRIIQCEDKNGATIANCGSGTRHLHISYK